MVYHVCIIILKEVIEMTKLKKLFPLSFKFYNSPKSLILGALIYGAIAIGVPYVITLVLNMVLTPFAFLAVIPIIGWFLILPIYSFVVAVLNIAINAVSFAIGAYAYAGIAVALMNYVKAEDTAEEETAEETAEENEAE